MRIFISLMLLISLAYADAACVIQVLNVKQKRSITPEFMAKVSAVKMKHTIRYIDGEYKVFLGDFQSKAEASSHLSQIRNKVSPDAFITSAPENTPLKADAKMQQMMVLAQAKLLRNSKEESPVSEPDKSAVMKEEKIETVDIPGPKEKANITNKETKSVVATQDEAKIEETFSEKTSQDVFCKPTKRALREAEISEALSFYKNSSYYRFNQGL